MGDIFLDSRPRWGREGVDASPGVWRFASAPPG